MPVLKRKPRLKPFDNPLGKRDNLLHTHKHNRKFMSELEDTLLGAIRSLKSDKAWGDSRELVSLSKVVKLLETVEVFSKESIEEVLSGLVGHISTRQHGVLPSLEALNEESVVSDSTVNRYFNAIKTANPFLKILYKKYENT